MGDLSDLRVGRDPGIPALTRYLLRRSLSLVATILSAAALTFLALRVIPGDAAQLALGVEADAEQLAALRRELGTDRPVLEQFSRWLSGLARGDLGRSLRYGHPVGELIAARLPVSLSLAGWSMVCAVLIGVPLGVMAAARRGRMLDWAAGAVAQAGLSVPSFALGLLLLIHLSGSPGWFPSGGYVAAADSPLGHLRSLALPAFALGLARGAALLRIVRNGLVEALAEPYVRTARAKGLAERAILYKHALRNALIPATTVFGLQLGQLLAGSVVVESVFSLPGLGRLLLQAIAQRDVPVVEGAVLVASAGVVLVNFAVDLAYGWLDPRTRARRIAA